MLFVASTNMIALLLGLLIGLVTAFWIFKVGRNPPPGSLDPQSQPAPKESPLP